MPTFILDFVGSTVQYDVMVPTFVSSISATFILTFLLTFTIGCICGTCFGKKCNKLQSKESHSCHDTTVIYEDVVPTDMKQHEQNLELKQNVAYLPASSSIK